MANICRRWNLFDSLRDFQAKGGAVWGTCAGLIFLAERINRGARRAGAPRWPGRHRGPQLLRLPDRLVRDQPAVQDPRRRQRTLPRHLHSRPRHSFRRRRGRGPRRVRSPRGEAREEIGDKALEKIIVVGEVEAADGDVVPPEITADTRWHKLFVEMAGDCEAYVGFGEDAVAKATASEIRLVDPGSSRFSSTRFCGPRHGLSRRPPRRAG